MKALSALAAVAWLAPAAPAFAHDPAAAGTRKADEVPAPAGAQVEQAWRDAKRHMDARRHVEAKRQVEAKRHLEARRQAYAHDYGKGVKEARRAKVELEHADAGLTRLFDTAPGYALFPAVAIGGGRATGVLFEKGHATGRATLTQRAIGLRPGGTIYTEVVFFETEKALAHFRRGGLAMGVQASSVTVAAGAAARAGYVGGVSVFTLAAGGAPAEAGVGGQTFAYRTFPYPVAVGSL
jgi:hypothetical protein